MPKVKKIVRRQRKKSPLLSVNGANAFWVHQGPILRSLWDLAKFLEIITEEQFVYHTKRDLPDGQAGGNDFARWVGEIIQDKICAGALARAKTRRAALAAARRALTRYDV
ncbi:MAG: hypothetical protein HY481_00200 [Candidatus Vogelbacteria bacterium]|nr:hypothetical protein [Candidatus Vogelbacteria bacterium]